MNSEIFIPYLAAVCFFLAVLHIFSVKKFSKYARVAGSVVGGGLTVIAMNTARDVRGFVTKFYTDEGNFDLFGHISVFLIQPYSEWDDRTTMCNNVTASTRNPALLPISFQILRISDLMFLKIANK